MLLLGQFESVKTGHAIDHSCMEGTWQSIFNGIVSWVATPQEGNEVPQRNTYWLYSSPGIGRMSLAHLVCERLHNQKHLAGAFFCRRDDLNLSKPGNILLTFIYKLTRIFPPFQRIVAEHLHSNPNLTPESMKSFVFLDFICSLPHHPKCALVFVINALNKCGDDKSCPDVLRVLSDTAAHAQWLRIIITSRPEVDIQCFFDTPDAKTSHMQYDLATDGEASSNL